MGSWRNWPLRDKKENSKQVWKDLRSAFKEIDKKRSTAISDIETQCKEMFVEDRVLQRIKQWRNSSRLKKI